jgi:predicted nuclease of restriction endonuclease-like (RecB) superfamily
MELDNNYIVLLDDIKLNIQSARTRTIRKVNRELMTLYWSIGQLILEKQASNNWGKSIVEQLAKDLKSSFPNTKGFSARNLWDMRRFYERYQHNEFLRQLVAEIPWGHNLLIINKIKNDAEATFYIQATAEYGWSRNVLLNQIKSKAMRINEIYQKINSIILKWHFQNIYQNRHPKR